MAYEEPNLETYNIFTEDKLMVCQIESEDDAIGLVPTHVFDIRHYFFIPLDKKLGWMLIKDIDIELLLRVRKDNSQDKHYFGASFLDWPAYSKSPWVKLEREIGLRGDIEKECEVLLRDHDVNLILNILM